MSHTLSLPQRIIGSGFQAVDSTLQTASYYAEKIDHTIRPVPQQTEKFANGFEGELYSPVAQVIEGVREQLKRGLPITLSLQNGAALVNALTADAIGGLDDRKMLLEYALTFLSRLPPDSGIGKRLQFKVLSLLWSDLPHPPATQVGKQYRYRSADGSGYALWNPDMGKAGSHYARTVQASHPLPRHQLPSPELLFDCLLKRDSQDEHPAGLSSFFFAFANLVIHQVFSTDHNSDDAINKTSSYVDLAIIYGNNQDEQNSVRAFDGLGNLLPDTFCDSRLLRMPPSSPALCVLLCRNHNFIAGKLLAINERGTWNSDLSSMTEDQKKAQDEDLFQTARLVNCGMVINVVLSDYLSSILGLVRSGNSFSLDLLETYRDIDKNLSSVGQGNLVSVEFVALYHFHATISSVDEKWVEGSMRQLFPNAQSWDDISTADYKAKIAGLIHMKLPPPNTWTFGKLKRQANGSFNDKELGDILKDAMEVPAGAFGARRTPHAMRIIEMMGIEQGRDWGVCSLNEFRKFLGLKPFSTFEEWNPRKDIAEAARMLYQHPDNIELYPGLQAEDTKGPVDGAGLCPGYTISRAILGDAAALVRGDRFLMTDMTAFNLTSWGLMDTKRHPENPSFGGIIPTLLMRALPDQFDPQSIYTQIPMMVPSKIKKYLTEIGIADKYNYDRPPSRTPMVALKSYADTQAALSNRYLAAPLAFRAQDILPGYGYLATYNRPDQNAADIKLIRSAFTAGPAARKHVDFFTRKTLELLKDRSYVLPGTTATRINIVKDVINLLPVHFVAHHVIGLALKTPTQSTGIYYEEELREKMQSISDYIFVEGTPFTYDLAFQITRKEQAKKDVADLMAEIHHHFDSVGGGRIPFMGVIDVASHLLLGEPQVAHEWLRRLVQSGKDRDELANDVIALAAAVSNEFSQTLSNVIDVLVDEPYNTTVAALAVSTSATSSAQLKGVIAEAIRLNPPLGGVCREVTSDTMVNGKQFHRGDRVFVSAVDANYDPAAFATPEKITLDRSNKGLLGDGLFRLLGEDWVLATMAAVVKGIFSMASLRRDYGVTGTLPGLKDAIPGGTQVRKYFDTKQVISPWATSMTLTFSGASLPTTKQPAGVLATTGSVVMADVKSFLSEVEGMKKGHTSPSGSGTPTRSGTMSPRATFSNGGASGVRPYWMPIFVGGAGGGANDPAYNAAASGSTGTSIATSGVSQTTASTRADAPGATDQPATHPDDMWEGHSQETPAAASGSG
ncbi:hypothetical protein FRB94_013112 [Tulasnella sp. JGI-2019a]|nr:hypothetical protein FRB94_013112 [Tulasnella sp. JGI-2019a]KAG9000761.1 hypothetical protein FRB93_012587 [Tulasnella sp. JGI-2019a]KAG9030300.1 hypothetical protein FRB95_004132 [Tulasnella sp. JGI-2019a]